MEKKKWNKEEWRKRDRERDFLLDFWRSRADLNNHDETFQELF